MKKLLFAMLMVGSITECAIAQSNSYQVVCYYVHFYDYVDISDNSGHTAITPLFQIQEFQNSFVIEPNPNADIQSVLNFSFIDLEGNWFSGPQALCGFSGLDFVSSISPSGNFYLDINSNVYSYEECLDSSIQENGYLVMEVCVLAPNIQRPVSASNF